MAKATKPAEAVPSAADLVAKLQAAGEAAAKRGSVLQVLMTKDGFRLVWVVQNAPNPNMRLAQDIPFSALAEDPEALLKACDRDPPVVAKAEVKPAAAQPIAALSAPSVDSPRGEAARQIDLAKARYAIAAEAPEGPERDAVLAEAREHQALAEAAFREALKAERAA